MPNLMSKVIFPDKTHISQEEKEVSAKKVIFL